MLWAGWACVGLGVGLGMECEVVDQGGTAAPVAGGVEVSLTWMFRKYKVKRRFSCRNLGMIKIAAVAGHALHVTV